jgi:hypothetical protein
MAVRFADRPVDLLEREVEEAAAVAEVLEEPGRAEAGGGIVGDCVRRFRPASAWSSALEE